MPQEFLASFFFLSFVFCPHVDIHAYLITWVTKTHACAPICTTDLLRDMSLCNGVIHALFGRHMADHGLSFLYVTWVGDGNGIRRGINHGFTATRNSLK